MEVLKLIIFHYRLIEERVILLKVPAVSNSTDIIQDRKHASGHPCRYFRHLAPSCSVTQSVWMSQKPASLFILQSSNVSTLVKITQTEDRRQTYTALLFDV